MKPLVSVVIPAYNRARTIKNCVMSALNQDYENLEVLVVDDGSTDETSAVVEGIDDKRVRLLRQGNAGANAARNHGIDAALGEYVAMLDSDDVFLPGHLTSSVELLEGSPARTLVYSQVVVDRGDGVTFLKPSRALMSGEDVGEYMLCDKGFVQTSTIVMRRDVAAEVRYLPGLPAGQDIDFAIRCANFGIGLIMKAAPGAVWMDRFEPGRISSAAHPRAREVWIDSIKGVVTDRAYHGFRGWFLAKAYAKKGEWARALRLYFCSVRYAPYSPKHSLVVLLQILLSGRVYRVLADIAIRARSAGPW